MRIYTDLSASNIISFLWPTGKKQSKPAWFIPQLSFDRDLIVEIGNWSISWLLTKCILLIAADQRAALESEGSDSKVGNMKAHSLLPLFSRSTCRGKQMVQMYSLRLKLWIQELVLLAHNPSNIVISHVYNLFFLGGRLNQSLCLIVLLNRKHNL